MDDDSNSIGAGDEAQHSKLDEADAAEYDAMEDEDCLAAARAKAAKKDVAKDAKAVSAAAAKVVNKAAKAAKKK
jgi:hypothetical protein